MIPVQACGRSRCSPSDERRRALSTGGACMMDATGSGQMDLVLMQSGAQAIRVLHRASDGKFEDWMRRRRG